MELDVQTYPPAVEKYKRILQLKKFGLNIPRMFYIAKGSALDLKLIKDFMKDAGISKFNIRTYTYNRASGKEGWKSEHYVGLSKDNIVKTLMKINSTHYCMVDAEVPADGRYAGNIVIQENGLCILEFVNKKGAMVRMVDSEGTTLQGNYKDVKIDCHVKQYNILADLVDLIVSTKQRGRLIEWSYLANPGGIKGENFIFWEWRSWIDLPY